MNHQKNPSRMKFSKSFRFLSRTFRTWFGLDSFVYRYSWRKMNHQKRLFLKNQATHFHSEGASIEWCWFSNEIIEYFYHCSMYGWEYFHRMIEFAECSNWKFKSRKLLCNWEYFTIVVYLKNVDQKMIHVWSQVFSPRNGISIFFGNVKFHLKLYLVSEVQFEALLYGSKPNKNFKQLYFIRES